jgi:predicted O-methyltransferase YrrM
MRAEARTSDAEPPRDEEATVGQLRARLAETEDALRTARLETELARREAMRASQAVQELLQTRTFRYTARLRALYRRLRSLASGERRPAVERGYVFPEDVESALSERECGRLAELAPGKRVLELGSWHGRSTITLASVAASVDAVDPHDGGPEGQENTLTPMLENLERYGVRERVTIHVGSSHAILPGLPERAFDLVLIDADHSLEAVLADLELVLPRLAPGGAIAFHDYGRSGTWHRGAWDTWGVTEVVDAFARQLGQPVDVVDSLAVVQVPEPPERPADPRSAAGPAE